LRSQLEYSGLLVKELAALSGVKKKTLDSYLRINGYMPSVNAAVSIAKALGVSVEYLVTATDSEKDRPLSSLNSVIQEIVLACEQLNGRDRQVILNLAKFMKKR